MAEPASACYVYCVVAADEVPALDDVAGLGPDGGVVAVTAGSLGALTSRVRLDEFGADALRRNLEDLAWVERVARAHDAVLTRALHADAVVPFRLCTIFGDADAVRGMLERERERLGAALARLRGQVEWSVKALADRRRLEATVRGGAEADAGAVGGADASGVGGADVGGPGSAEAAGEASPGRAFFARKQADLGRERARRRGGDRGGAAAAAGARAVGARGHDAAQRRLPRRARSAGGVLGGGQRAGRAPSRARDRARRDRPVGAVQLRRAAGAQR